jgi:hypothetical protein
MSTMKIKETQQRSISMPEASSYTDDAGSSAAIDHFILRVNHSNRPASDNRQLSPEEGDDDVTMDTTLSMEH